jgi:sulfonate transport system ATP-binding protein
MTIFKMAAQAAPPITASRGSRQLAVQSRGVTRAFNGRVVLDQVDLEIPAGQFVALLGASGSGKTTFLRILAGLDRATSGRVLVPRVRTVVFQEPRLVQSKRVWWNVSVGQDRPADAKQAAIAALKEVGLAERFDAWPATLSGGEAQRVALARALVREPQLLLLDEPFAALDALTRLHMQELVGDLCARHHPAVLIVTHDVEEAILLADRVLVLRNGKISFDADVDLARPRVMGGAEFDRLRIRLLAELGVLHSAEPVSENGAPAGASDRSPQHSFS